MAVAELSKKQAASNLGGPVSGLIGAVLVVVSVGVVFWGIPAVLMVNAWPEWLQFLGGALSFLIVLAAAVAVAVGLVRFSKTVGTPETPAFTVIALLGFAAIGLFVLAIGWWMDRLVYQGGAAKVIGQAIMLGSIGFPLVLGVRLYFAPGAAWLASTLTGQGWFSTASYKKAQGVMMRRITLSVLLLILGSGIYSLLGSTGVRRGGDLAVSIPFTGMVNVDRPGDAQYLPNKVSKDDLISREAFATIKEQLNPENFVKIGLLSKDSKFKTNEIVSKESYQEESRRFKEEGGLKNPADIVTPVLPEGKVEFGQIPLLPNMQFSLPLLILAVGFWLSWRLVNVPLFSEFLISTESEMNKVSWTSWGRLMQDTLVVLSTLIFFAVTLFAMDIAWKQILSSRWIGVLQFQESTKDQNANPENKPW